MSLLFSLIIAALFYKIKLIDDRCSKTFDKYKEYLKRQGRENLSSGVSEKDVWLDKDIPALLLAEYEKFKENNGEKQAILDYYTDFVDNKQDREFLILLIIITTSYLVLLDTHIIHLLVKNQQPILSELEKAIVEVVIVIFSIYLCFKGHSISLFNNEFINIKNSSVAKTKYEKIVRKIDKEISKTKKKYKIVQTD
jgi:hypothetical protein